MLTSINPLMWFVLFCIIIRLLGWARICWTRLGYLKLNRLYFRSATYWAICGIGVSELAQPEISSELQWWVSAFPCLKGKSSRACRIRAVCWFFSSSSSSCSVLLLRLPSAVPVEPVEVDVLDPKMLENRTLCKLMVINYFLRIAYY